MESRRMINTKFWSDSYVSELDPIEKLLYLYLITNERVSICGIYELPIKFMSLETGIEKEMIIKILSRFEHDEKVFLKNGFVFIKNFIKNQNTESPTIKIAIQNQIDKLPLEIREMVDGMDTVWGRYVYGIYTVWGKGKGKGRVEREDVKGDVGVDTVSPPPSHFEKFWQEYPKHAGRESAERSWRSMKLDDISDKIMNFVALAKETDRWKRGFVPNAKRFLDESRWEDDLETYMDAKPPAKGKKLGLIC